MTNINKKMLTPPTIAFLGGLVALLIAYYGAWVQEKSNQVERKELLAKNQELKNELEETKYYLTGGEGFCYAEITMFKESTKKQSDKAEIKVKHCGKYPLHNIEFSIVILIQKSVVVF